MSALNLHERSRIHQGEREWLRTARKPRAPPRRRRLGSWIRANASSSSRRAAEARRLEPDSAHAGGGDARPRGPAPGSRGRARPATPARRLRALGDSRRSDRGVRGAHRPRPGGAHPPDDAAAARRRSVPSAPVPGCPGSTGSSRSCSRALRRQSRGLAPTFSRRWSPRRGRSRPCSSPCAGNTWATERQWTLVHRGAMSPIGPWEHPRGPRSTTHVCSRSIELKPIEPRSAS